MFACCGCGRRLRAAWTVADELWIRLKPSPDLITTLLIEVGLLRGSSTIGKHYFICTVYRKLLFWTLFLVADLSISFDGRKGKAISERACASAYQALALVQGFRGIVPWLLKSFQIIIEKNLEESSFSFERFSFR